MTNKIDSWLMKHALIDFALFNFKKNTFLYNFIPNMKIKEVR